MDVFERLNEWLKAPAQMTDLELSMDTDKHAKIENSSFLIRDVTEKRKTQRQLVHPSRTNGRTQIPTRVLFYDSLEEASFRPTRGHSCPEESGF